MLDLSVVIGLDKNTIRQAGYSIPTWRKNRKELWDCPWVVFADTCYPNGIAQDQLENFLGLCGLSHAQIVPWNGDVHPDVSNAFETQREKMLTGFVQAPAEHVRTDWWMKIDTDTIAYPHDGWYDPAWFVPEHDYIAPRWSYTKAKGGGGSIQDWAAALEKWGDQLGTPRLGLENYINGRRIDMKRMCSWLSYYRTETSKTVASFCPGFLPVPSQDTTVWYYTARSKRHAFYVNMKRHGWSNISRTARLKEEAEKVLYA